MKKSYLLVIIIALFSIYALGGCSNKPSGISSSGLKSEQSSEVNGSENSTSEEITSDISSSDGTSFDESTNLSDGSNSSKASTTSISTVSNTSVNTSTTATPASSNIYARFKLTGGSGDVILKDMDNLGFIGTCPLKYTNAQNGETIKNAEWKTDSKFSKYFNALHSATKIFFDASEDAKAGEKSARLKTEVPFTVSAWIFPATYTPSGSPDFRVIAAYGANGPIDHWDLKLGSNNELSFYHSAIATGDQRDSGVILDANKWYHVSVTFSATELVYYVNGVAVRTNKFKGDLEFLPTRGNFAIGGLVEGAYSFRGGIAEVCIFKGIVAPKDTTKYPIQ